MNNFYQEKNTVEQIAFEIKKMHLKNTAFLIHNNTVYFSTNLNIVKKPYSAVTALIQGIYDSFLENALFILRSRIYSTEQPTEMCLGMVKVAAKRFTFPIEAKNHKIKVSFIFKEVKPSFLSYNTDMIDKELLNVFHNNEFMELAINLSKKVVLKKEKFESNRKIASILVSTDNKLLAFGINENCKNKTKHAEINMIQNFYHKFSSPIPKNSIIYTTLKPCKMCAGMIWSCAEDISTIKVYYLHDDTGSFAKHTVLGCGTLERNRAACNKNEANVVIEEKFTF